MDPEVYAAFKASSYVSGKYRKLMAIIFFHNQTFIFLLVQNGVSNNMMKATAKRRRSRVQILEDKSAAIKKETEMQEKLAAWNHMEAAL